MNIGGGRPAEAPGSPISLFSQQTAPRFQELDKALGAQLFPQFPHGSKNIFLENRIFLPKNDSRSL